MVLMSSFKVLFINITAFRSEILVVQMGGLWTLFTNAIC